MGVEDFYEGSDEKDISGLEEFVNDMVLYLKH